jgi:hypothetical protein
MSPGKQIRQAFAQLAATAAGVTNALDHEPETIPTLERGACVTLMQHRTDATTVETGPGQDVVSEWTVIVYVQLREYEKAQDDLEDVLDALIAVLRDNDRLNGTCDEARLHDDGAVPEFHNDHGVLVKTLRLWTQVTEHD